MKRSVKTEETTLSKYDRHHVPQDWIQLVRQQLGSPPDLVFRTLTLDERPPIQCMYLETMADKKAIDEYVQNMLAEGKLMEGAPAEAEDFGYVREMRLTAFHGDLVRRIVDSLVEGQCVILDPAKDRICFLNAVAPVQRQTEEPKSETIVRGPHEGFIEDIQTNVSLVRKRLKNPALRFEKMEIGKQTRTTVLLAYLDNLAPDKLVEEARRRLKAIRTNSVLESSYIEEYIQDRTWSPFSTLTNTEKPDVVASQLLEGKIAILIDGTPTALIAPVTFWEFFNSPEDYYQRADIATFIRWIRLISFFTAVFVPSLYVAATTFHQELIPPRLLISLSAQREGVPFSALFEVLLMEIVFEVIREAGLRMPRAVGQALSIVGAIVLGQAAVEAGLISAAIVIVVSITGITNFVVPVYSFGTTQRLLRFSFILLAGFLGLFGVLCGVLFLAAHLVTLRSFGIPYMTPITPVRKSGWKDVLIRIPRPQMDKTGIGYLRKIKTKW